MIEEGEIAGDYLEQLLDVLDFDGDIDLDVEGDRAVVSIDGGQDLTKLVGRKGEVLDALQELTADPPRPPRAPLADGCGSTRAAARP